MVNVPWSDRAIRCRPYRFTDVNELVTILLMRRSLVLTNEVARHPFRMSLPQNVFRVARENEEDARKAARHADDQDWKLFLLSFTAFFTVACSFIA